MLLPFSGDIWFYPKPVDFRKQLDALIILIADHLKKNPSSGELFLFRSRSAQKMKMVWWDRNGFWLFYRRFEKGRFQFPRSQEDAMLLTRDQMNWLLSGLNFLEHQLLPEIKPTIFF
jgi:transposase